MSRAIRVVHVLPYSAQSQGGHSNAILSMMDAQSRHGMEVRAISPVLGVSLPQKRSIEGLPIREIDFRSGGFLRTAIAAVEDTDLVHFQGYTSSYGALGGELRRRAIPYVVTSHGNLNFRSLAHGLKKLVYINFLTRLFRRAGGLHFLTEHESVRCRRLLPTWKGPILVQGNLVEVPDPSMVKGADRIGLGIPADAFIFCFMGRLDVECKGLDLLVKAFARLAGKPWLLFVGGDWEGGQAVLERLATELRCQDRVRFAGFQLGDRKWEFLKMADAFVAPSRWECFSLAQAEAIGFALPTLITSTVNTASEWRRDNVTLVCDLSVESLAAAMQRLASDEALRRMLAVSGRRWVLERCSVSAGGPGFERFYRTVLRQPSNGARQACPVL